MTNAPPDEHVPMTRPDLMLAQHDQDYGHSYTFADLDDGRIMHFVWNALTFSEDGGLTWSELTRCRDERGEDVTAASSLVNLDKGVGLVCQVNRHGDRTRGYDLLFYRSFDDGTTWQAPIRIDSGDYPPHMLMDAAKRLSSGRIILPVYTELKMKKVRDGQQLAPFVGGLLETGQWVSTAAHFYDPTQGGCWVIYSDDEGLTWHTNRDGMLHPWTDWEVGVHAAYEPVVTEIAPGRLLMFMRTWLGRLYQSISSDNGETWTPPAPTDLASDHSPAALATIPDTGHLICVWNQHNEQEIREGKVRTRLSSAVSRNHGILWEFFQNVESIYPETRLPPGPIRPCRPEERYLHNHHQAAPWDPEPVRTLPAGYGRWSYPALHVSNDRALVANTYTKYNDDGDIQAGSRLKVLPLEWFYGGRDRFRNNSMIEKSFKPATP